EDDAETRRESARSEERLNELRDRFWALWNRESWDATSQYSWMRLQTDLTAVGIVQLPSFGLLSPLILAMINLRDFDPAVGKMVGWDWSGERALIEMIHHFFAQHRQRLMLLLEAM